METGKQTHEIYEALSFDKFGRLVFSSSSVSTKEATEGMKATLQKDNNGAPDGTIKDVCNSFNRQLTLTILPTEKCDFKCVYCFEKFELGMIKPSVIEGVKNLISNRINDLSDLNVMWYGGEPLLAYNQVVEVMRHINALKPSSLRIYSEMTTNGYNLTIDKFTTLVNVGVRTYQISFDGEQEEHNKLRLRRDEKPSFDTILGNLIAAHRTNLDFTIKVRLHINNINEQSVMRLLRRFKSEIDDDDRFEFNVRGLMKLGGENDATLPVISKDSKSVSNVVEFAKSLGFKITPRDPTYICYASKPNSYMIRPNGSIIKCGVHIYRSENRIGVLNPDGTLALDTQNTLRWSRGMFSGDRVELSCPALNFPNGK